MAEALGVSVEYLLTGREMVSASRLFSHKIRLIMEMLLDFTEKDIEILLGLARILKKQSER